jgi:DnaK suppressor protein
MTSPEKPSAAQNGDPKRTELDKETAESAGLTTAELSILREKLLAARDAIARKVSAHGELAVPTESHMADEMDQASSDQEMGFMLLLASKDLSLTAEIDAALKRLDDGTYGLCEGTDEPIGFRRLEARPWTRYSVGYQEQLEREERARGQR